MNASWRGDQRPLREMIEGRVERRLAAILAVDVAGYSRLMGEDEEGTLGALRAVRREPNANGRFNLRGRAQCGPSARGSDAPNRAGQTHALARCTCSNRIAASRSTRGGGSLWSGRDAPAGCGRGAATHGGCAKKLWWFIMNQISTTIATSRKFTRGSGAGAGR